MKPIIIRTARRRYEIQRVTFAYGWRVTWRSIDPLSRRPRGFLHQLLMGHNCHILVRFTLSDGGMKLSPLLDGVPVRGWFSPKWDTYLTFYKTEADARAAVEQEGV